MAYKLKFSQRRFDSIFGKAYPNLPKIDDNAKKQFIARLLKQVATNECNIDIVATRLFLDVSYQIDISGGRDRYQSNNVKGYNTAVELEGWIKSIPRLGILSPPRWWYKMLFWRRPKDSFMIDNLNKMAVVKWLAENLKPSDFQIYTKFDEDISLGFCNPEHATMFKLTFGDEIV